MQILKVSQPRVSDVVNQKTNLFTMAALVGMMSNMGKKVHLLIE